MINKIERCINITNASVIKFEEKGKSIVFNNPKRLNYKKVQVDGCTINKGARCDKLLLSEDEREEYFVELKGSDIKHAIEQIESSMSMPKNALHM